MFRLVPVPGYGHQVRCQVSVKSAMECTGKKFGRLRAEKRFFEVSVACWNYFLSFSPVGVALVLTKKKQNLSQVQRESSQDGGSLEDLFSVCPQTRVALDTANLITFLQKMQPGTKSKFLNFLEPWKQTRPLPVSMRR